MIFMDFTKKKAITDVLTYPFLYSFNKILSTETEYFIVRGDEDITTCEILLKVEAI